MLLDIIIILSLSLLLFILSYNYLLNKFKKGNQILLNQHREDLRQLINSTQRIKILETRLLKILSELRITREEKSEILKCLRNEYHSENK